MRKTVLALVLTLGLALSAGQPLAGAQQQTEYQPGAPGAGDAYFPLDGNGGYDVQHYLLELTYDPATDLLVGVATIRARATQDLSRFNLDLDGLSVRSITVNRRRATWARDSGELSVSPQSGLRAGRRFTTVVHYDGVPKPVGGAQFGLSGFIHTDDGTLVAGEPHVAATWFPSNDHPSDKAAYTFSVTVPKGLEAVANGILEGRRSSKGWTTWRWEAREPMASYLATATVGEFDLHSYREDGILYWDAIDPDLLAPVAEARTGSQLAISHRSEKPSYKRLVRIISVPDGGAKLSFWVTRDTEPNWDYTFVEARTVGRKDWTTLRDLNGHTGDDTGFVCPYWLGLHPFLAHYQAAKGEHTCSPTGTTGKWWAVSGASDGWEQWEVDLSRYSGSDVRVSITYASDDLIQLHGVFIDDIVVSTGSGTTSFEDDGNTLDGWAVPGAPKGSKANPNDWTVGTPKEGPRPFGKVAQASFGRQGEVIDFLSDAFGPYPFSAAGGIVDDQGIGFALENQTRPIYDKDFFYYQQDGDFVVVHELAHQWYGDSLAVASWKHIWLNEGFATYAEWLWSKREKLDTAQQIFDSFYGIPAKDPFWALTIGDPGPKHLFDFPVYARGAMTLHRLRLAVGDGDFFEILQRWAASRSGGIVTTGQFIRLAEEVSGKNLDELFNRWLFTAKKPQIGTAPRFLGAPGVPKGHRQTLKTRPPGF